MNNSKSASILRKTVRRWQWRWHLAGQVGLALTALGGAWTWSMLLASNWLGILFLTMPFTVLGVLMAALGLIGRYSPWVHVRVETERKTWPRNVAFSFPLPVNEITWLVNVFGNYIESDKRAAINELLETVREQISPEQPIHVEVLGERLGERVQVLVS